MPIDAVSCPQNRQGSNCQRSSGLDSSWNESSTFWLAHGSRWLAQLLRVQGHPLVFQLQRPELPAHWPTYFSTSVPPGKSHYLPGEISVPAGKSHYLRWNFGTCREMHGKKLKLDEIHGKKLKLDEEKRKEIRPHRRCKGRDHPDGISQLRFRFTWGHFLEETSCFW